MPHMAIEYSANLDETVDIQGLCTLVADTILETGLFEIGAIRVRAFRAEAYAIADRLPQNGFIDMNFRIGKAAAPRRRSVPAKPSLPPFHSGWPCCLLPLISRCRWRSARSTPN